MIFEITGQCAFEDCDQPATVVACGRKRWDKDEGHPHAACYCRTHANEVVDEGSPEYSADCPNCGCEFGVN